MGKALLKFIGVGLVIIGLSTFFFELNDFEKFTFHRSVDESSVK